ncbi:phosphotransferase family protein [Halorarius halobius]|uniref:phosphotransferase family protein n=1 Tax=Halorarius halobius TaxID=2962671 RepID=UPI0020CCD25D|nr:aminoglycoside phosphotransferase family protein [Halorarius halobius]
MSDPLHAATARAFPDRSVETIESRNARPGNETGRVRFADADPLYLKTATDTTTRLERETAATRYAAENCPVGVPSVVAADPAGDPPYLATAPLPGTALNEPWTDGADRERLLRRAGQSLAGVHEARFDRAGRVVGGDTDGLELTDETWTETLAATVEWRGDDWFADRFSGLPPRLADLIREVDPTVEGRPALVHGDASRLNVHVDPGGLLDWERALVGDPAFDLADATFHLTGQPDVTDDERPALREALHEGYRERAGALPPGLDRWRPLYRAVAYLLVPQAFDDWSTEAEAPADDLAADVREEFDERLRAAREALT